MVLSFLKEKGYKWENGDDLEQKELLDEYWNEFKSKIYVFSKLNNLVVYGIIGDLLKTDTEDKKLIKELKEQEKIHFNKENLNKLLLISHLK